MLPNETIFKPPANSTRLNVYYFVPQMHSNFEINITTTHIIQDGGCHRQQKKAYF